MEVVSPSISCISNAPHTLDLRTTILNQGLQYLTTERLDKTAGRAGRLRYTHEERDIARAGFHA